MRHITFAKAVLAAAVAVAFIQTGIAADQKAAGKPVTITIMQQNQSGESGTATLTPLDGNKTKVEITLKSTPQGVTQPAHIHEGGCANLDPKPKQGLDSVVDGKSTTVVPVSLQELIAGKTAINVHKSTDDLKTYVACGDIRAEGGATK
jgi:Cu/Zn superoxide dismutase